MLSESFANPYSPFCGKNYGIGFSSEEKLGPILGQKGLGAAQWKCWPNLATGNLFAKDRVLLIEEENFVLDLYYGCNTQIKDPRQAWQFSMKRFFGLPQMNAEGLAQAQQGGITLQQEDGHLLSFISQPHAPLIYLAAQTVNGTQTLRYDLSSKLWILQDPLTGMAEYYYPYSGLLAKKKDAKGRITAYEYDQHYQISAIVTPKNRYEIQRTKNQIKIYSAHEDKILQIYEFDALGRLSMSKTADGYQTEYSYINESSLIDRVVQSDGTRVQLA